MSSGQTKGEILVTNVLAPYSVEPILLSVVCQMIHQIMTRKKNPLSFHSWTDKWRSNCLLHFYKDFHETKDNIKLLISCPIINQILLIYKKCPADTASVNLGQFNSLYKFIKENENILLAKTAQSWSQHIAGACYFFPPPINLIHLHLK